MMGCTDQFSSPHGGFNLCLQMKGIVKQGVRCRDCGTACHKHCKDHVVVDCTKRKERKCKGVTLATVGLIIPPIFLSSQET